MGRLPGGLQDTALCQSPNQTDSTAGLSEHGLHVPWKVMGSGWLNAQLSFTEVGTGVQVVSVDLATVPPRSSTSVLCLSWLSHW